MLSLRRISIAAAAFLAAFSFGFAQTAPPAPAPIITNAARSLPVVAQHGMVVSQEKLATHVGVEILKAGGNAVDAAVAVGFALAVTHPQAGNIGGGGFMLVHLAARNETIAIDYRETAPAAMTRGCLPRRQGRGRSGEVARLGARRRRARHGRGTRARAREIRLGQIHAGATDRARDQARARRLSGRGRPRRFAAARAAAPRALARLARRSSSRPTARRSRAATRLVQIRSRGLAGDDRRRRPARLLRRAARRKDRRGPARRAAAS